MQTMSPTKLYTVVLFMVLTFLSGCGDKSRNAKTSNARLLFQPSSRKEVAANQRMALKINRSGFVDLNTNILESLPKPGAPPGRIADIGDNQPERSISLQLFPDVRFDVVFDSYEEEKLGSKSWFGHLDGAYGEFLLTDYNNVLSGNLRVAGKGYFQIHPIDSGDYAVEEIDTKALPICGYGKVNLPSVPAGAGQKTHVNSLKEPSADTAATTTSVSDPFPDDIDILVLYTQDVRVAMGGKANVESLVRDCYFATDYAYQRSVTGAHVRLAGTYGIEVSYAESGFLSTDLGRLETSGDGFLDEAQTLRERAGFQADIVILLVNSSDVGGLANEMSQSTFNHDFESSAFGVVEWRSALGNMIFPHEVSHILGCGHDRKNGGPGIFADSAGYHVILDRPTIGKHDYRTIMSYRDESDDIDDVLMSYFSNPSVTNSLLGVPVGDQDSNNASAIRQTFTTVAHFRERH